MKKRIAAVITALLLTIALSFVSSGVNLAFSPVKNTAYPHTKINTKAKWVKKVGTSYMNAPTAPVICGDYLLFLSAKNLVKMSRKDGNIISKTPSEGSVMFSVAGITCYKGIAYAVMDGGIVQAFDIETMKSLWIYRNAKGGQAVSPIVCRGKYLYAGFWNGETKEADFVCLNTTDTNTKKTDEEKKARWTFSSNGGFYCAGAAITEKYVIVGSDDGQNGSQGKSRILVLRRSDGKKVSSVQTTGDIRSSVYYSKSLKRYFCTSKSGYMYSFAADSSTGKISALKKLKTGLSSTSTPAVYKNRAYIGVMTENGGEVWVINAKTMKKIYSCSAPGYPQSSAVISRAYENKTGKIYVYFTCNSRNGELICLADSEKATSGKAVTIYTPAKNNRQYCISPIAAAGDGTLYYKNDSGCIYAICKRF